MHNSLVNGSRLKPYNERLTVDSDSDSASDTDNAGTPDQHLQNPPIQPHSSAALQHTAATPNPVSTVQPQSNNADDVQSSQNNIDNDPVQSHPAGQPTKSTLEQPREIVDPNDIVNIVDATSGNGKQYYKVKLTTGKRLWLLEDNVPLHMIIMYLSKYTKQGTIRKRKMPKYLTKPST